MLPKHTALPIGDHIQEKTFPLKPDPKPITSQEQLAEFDTQTDANSYEAVVTQHVDPIISKDY